MDRYRQNGKTGSFLAINNGLVEGCVADVSFTAKSGGAGFVYENNARIINSATVRCIRGKNARGFYVRNGGTIEASGYIAGKGARRVGRDGVEEYIFGNPELYISVETPTEEIRRNLGLDTVWKNGASKGGAFVPDMKANL